MPNRRLSFIEMLRIRPDVRKEFALCWAMIVVGYGIHGWIDSSLITRMAESMPPTRAANLGGLLAGTGAGAGAAGITTGWIAGRWLIEFRHPIGFTDGCVENPKHTLLIKLQDSFDHYPLSRGLLLGGLALLAGAALGYWLLLASLGMALAFSMGYWGRVMALRTAGREF